MKGKAMMMAAMAAAMMEGMNMLDDRHKASKFHDDGKPPKQIIPKGVKGICDWWEKVSRYKLQKRITET